MQASARTSEPVLGRPRRIAVLGCSGSGKSTLAAALAEQLALPYRASDAIFWLPDWRPTPACDVRAWLQATTDEARWVVDGNFDDDRDLLWRRAELIVWLDLPLGVTMSRVLRRNLGWWLAGRPAWGQRMTLAKAAGGARHALRSHALKRRIYPARLAETEAAVVRLTSPAAVERWLRDAAP